VRTVEVLEIRIHNFRSIRDEKIIFPTEPGLRFLGGQNDEEPDLGANGAGKTTIWWAMRWCFYGDGKLSMLTTWGEKDTWVEVDVKVSDKVHTIKRWGPPAYLYLDGQRTEQGVIDALLGLKRLPFQHSIIFNQGYRLFPDLTVPERGDLLEDVLGLEFWMRCAWTTTNKYSELEKQVQKKKITLAGVQGELKGLPSEESLQMEIDEWEVNHQQKLKTLQLQLLNWDEQQAAKITNLETSSTRWLKEWEEKSNAELERLGDELDEVTTKIEEFQNQLVTTDQTVKLLNAQNNDSVLEGRLRAIQSAIAVKESRHQSIERGISSMQGSGYCPTCGQVLTNANLEEIEKHLQEQRDALSNLEVQVWAEKESAKKLQIEVTESRKITNQIVTEVAVEKERVQGVKKLLDLAKKSFHRLEDECREVVKKSENPNGNNPYVVRIEEARKEANPYKQFLLTEEEQKNPYIKAKDEVQMRRNALLSEETHVSNEIKNLNNNLALVEFWKQGFKRIRLYLTNKVLAALAIEINSAISTLGMKGWSVDLSTETETKSGTVKLGIQIQVHSPKQDATWESWSGGESQRLRLAMAQGLASLIQRASGSWWPLEVWDEASTYLSEEGIEDMLETLDYRAAALNKTIFICDHTALTYSNFKEIWMAKKDPQLGTKIEQIGAM
jgi:DNA repair exonuclease SbcCD ATPase subunit